MFDEIFKNGVAWFMGAAISGVACMNFLIDWAKHIFN